MKLILVGIVACLSIFHNVDGEPTTFGVLMTAANSLCNLELGRNGSRNYLTPKKEKVAFELRTPCSRIKHNITETDLFNNMPEFDVNNPTIVFVSGWQTEMNEEYTEEMTKAFNCRGGNNFIVVDTAGYIHSNIYYPDAYNTQQLGEFVAEGLKNLKVSSEKIHLIGHSLGSHIVGSAGRTYEKLTGKKIGRITGLDPARPCFVDEERYPRLGINDANYVDIIHSNNGEAGIEQPIGHADFYPNGNFTYQPGCVSIRCSHEKSLWYFIETIYKENENNFIGKECNNQFEFLLDICNGKRAVMGYSANATGAYMVTLPFTFMFDRHFIPRNLENCGLCEK